MSKCKSDGRAAGSPAWPELVCTLVVDNTFDEFEVEICCQRTDGVDRAFATFKDLNWLRAERPSESTLAYSAETLLFHIIWTCLYYVGEPVDVRAGLLSKKNVEAIISSVRLEMEEIKKENEVWWESEIVTKADQLGLSPMASKLGAGIWIARCPGTNHYRLYAACCAEIARRASDQSRRARLLNLAQMWLRLVRSVRRQTGTSGPAMPRLPTQRAEIVT
jgi:hypothetical protein